MASSTPTQPPKAKFSVYQNPSFSAALTAKSLQPSPTALRLAFLASIASASLLLAVLTRERSVVDRMTRLSSIIGTCTCFATRILQVLAGLVFFSTLGALAKALSRRKTKRLPDPLTRRQMGLLGLKKPKQEEAHARPVNPPPKKSQRPQTLVPIRKSSHIHTTPPFRPSSGGKMGTSPSSLGSQFDAAKGAAMSPISPVRSPWLKSGGKDIMTEEMLEQFLADVDENIVESSSTAQLAAAAATPTAGIRGFGIASPGSVGSSVTNSGTARSTTLRPVRVSPGSHQKKYATPPKKGDGELPPPMSMEEMIAGYECLEIYPEIERWRDWLRQWFSSVLLGPLVEKIDTSHIQVIQSAGSLGISISVNQVGMDSLTTPAPVNVSPIDGTKEWQPSFTLDEDGVLHQLCAFLIQARDASASQVPQAGVQAHQESTLVPLMQSCINAITEHQRLNALMKGELVKGLLPQSSVRADHTARRVRELAEGTCVKNYEYGANGEVYDKANKKWTSELPSDSHLLGYLFCCFLDHPKWMLHVEPTSYSSTRAGKNPLFLGCLPPKERFPEKYVAIVSSAPSIIHPGACILVIGKKSPPIFTLYWDMKLQFSLQGRTALWDALVLLCHRIKVGFGGVVRGLHLGSSAFNILPVFESKEDD